MQKKNPLCFRKLVWVALPLLLNACGKENFLHYEIRKDPQHIHFFQNVKEIQGSSAVDILWVIDNSGSMGGHQQNVIRNTGIFIDTFTQVTSLDWKMGLISTDLRDRPYLGFASGTPFNSSTLRPVETFQSAVASLGTSGDGTERTLSPILQALNNDPNFLRPGVPLALMLITDAEEQSGLNFDTQFALPFRDRLGAANRFFSYQVLNATDLGCSGEGGGGSGPWNYTGSPYERLASLATLGKTFPLCQADFGQLLAQIGTEITEQVSRPIIYLDARPKVATLKVTYEDQELLPGDRENGGIWFYDFDLNAVVFYRLDFAANPTDGVKVTFDVDDGY